MESCRSLDLASTLILGLFEAAMKGEGALDEVVSVCV